MPEIKTESNHEEEYREFLQELQDSGVVADGDAIAKDGIGLIQPPEVKHTNAALIATAINAQQIYEKIEKIKGYLLDFMARTNFRSDKEFKYFMDYVEWTEDYGVGYDGPLRWLVGLNSISGMARNQYIDAITMTSYRFPNRGGYGQQQNRFKPKYKEGELP